VPRYLLYHGVRAYDLSLRTPAYFDALRRRRFRLDIDLTLLRGWREAYLITPEAIAGEARPIFSDTGANYCFTAAAIFMSPCFTSPDCPIPRLDRSLL